MANVLVTPQQFKAMELYNAKTGGIYWKSNENLVRRMPFSDGPVLEIGCRSGNFTIETLSYFSRSFVTAVERNSDMLSLAKIKFGVDDASGLMSQLSKGDANDRLLASFLSGFLQEVNGKRLGNRVAFVHNDFLPSAYEVDVLVAPHFMHLFGEDRQPEIAAKFSQLVCKGGCVGVSSSMSFYKPAILKAEDVSYLQHPFVRAYFDILAGKIEAFSGKPVRMRSQQEKKHKDETITLFEQCGFTLHKYDEVPLPPLMPEPLVEFALKSVPETLGMFDAAGEMQGDAKLRCRVVEFLS